MFESEQPYTEIDTNPKNEKILWTTKKKNKQTNHFDRSKRIELTD
jgi:hypothetical protein